MIVKVEYSSWSDHTGFSCVGQLRWSGWSRWSGWEILWFGSWGWAKLKLEGYFFFASGYSARASQRSSLLKKFLIKYGYFQLNLNFAYHFLWVVILVNWNWFIILYTWVRKGQSIRHCARSLFVDSRFCSPVCSKYSPAGNWDVEFLTTLAVEIKSSILWDDSPWIWCLSFLPERLLECLVWSDTWYLPRGL